MTSPESYLSDASRRSSWVMVPQTEGQHTRDRTPQYNYKNESQAQLASTSTGNPPHAEDHLSIDSDGDDSGDNIEAMRRTMSRKTVSNTTTDTNDTLTGLDMAGPTGNKVTASNYPVTQDLTKMALVLHDLVLQRTTHQVGDIVSWAAGTGNPAVRRVTVNSSTPSMIARLGRKSKPSTASSISQDFEHVSYPTEFPNDILGFGALFE